MNADSKARTHTGFGETHLQTGRKITNAPSYRERIEMPMWPRYSFLFNVSETFNRMM